MKAAHKTIILSASIIAFCLLLVGVDYWSSYRPQVNIIEPSAMHAVEESTLPLPFDLSLNPLIEGQSPLVLIDYQGQGVLINIWASWCAPCVKEIPMLFDVAERHPDLQVIFLSVDDRAEDAMRFMAPFQDRPSTNIHQSWDPEREVSARIFQTYRYPETILINEKGRITQKIIGLVDWTDPGIDRMIEGLSH